MPRNSRWPSGPPPVTGAVIVTTYRSAQEKSTCGPLPPLQVPVLARDHPGSGHDAGAVGGGQQAELAPDELAHAREPVGRERGTRGDAVAPLRREAVADRRDGPEHALKRCPDPRGRRV
jgi:hypothetical protein